MTQQPRAYTRDQIHRETVVEEHFVAQLVALQGYIEREPEEFDRMRALDPALLIRFLKDTQPAEWTRLESSYGASSETELLTQLEKALRSRGALDLLRNGIKIVPGIRFVLMYPQPASRLNPELDALYRANILSVMRQVRYSTKCENAIDVVLFVNGIPVATLEFKNTATGTTFRHAEHQYRTDRSPAGEPLLTFKRGALVHFALDQDNVSMTTRLMNGKTRFLPFNRGRDGGAGNADIEDEFRIAYLYQDLPDEKAVFSRDVLIDIISRFLHLEVVERPGEPKRETIIFPRYQQLDAVRKIARHAGLHGAGHAYLIQHSAGSGKSNTIAWAAHRLITLHDADDRAIFDTVIIVTDRVVLDRQLQANVAAFSQTAGVVKKIDGTSKQLKEAILAGARIIITTIQKFSTDHLKELSGQGNRRFAIIVDEAHSSQSGKTADDMARVLSRSAETPEDIEEIIAWYQSQRGPQPNLSYLAFTATPRNVTLERFGTPGPDGLPRPFHLYSMRQAIEEGFILDVLANYMTYKAYYQLEKVVDEDPEFDGRRAQRKVARYASLHPTAIGQKVEVIVEHFRRHVAHELDGKAKAMIVTQSREHAVRYYLAVKKYIEENGYDDVRALVAFSGDIQVDGETYREPDMNGFGETELTRRFDGADYQVLIVAEKYQTGFDQPKLCAMYVDKRLSGLQAVQTLSRLNRTFQGGAKQTFVLDFQNTIEEIQDAFRPYYEVTAVEALSDPNQIYELEGRLRRSGIIDRDEVERFAASYFQPNLTAADRLRLEGLVRAAVARFEIEDDEQIQEEFRQLVRSFMRFYSFVAQVVRLSDTDLEKLYAYTTLLNRLLPNRDVPGDVVITDEMVRLRAFRVTEHEDGDASLTPGENSHLGAITAFGANPYTEEEERTLSEIIAAFNERHGTEFSSGDFIPLEQVTSDLMDDEFMDMLRNNPPDVALNAFRQAFLQGMVQKFQRENQMKNIMMTDRDARDRAIMHFFNRAVREARATRPSS